MRWFSKKVEVPSSNDTKLVDAIQLWEVRWQSRQGEYSGNTQPEMEAFPTEFEAQAFATALKSAFKLIRHSSGTYVSVVKAR